MAMPEEDEASKQSTAGGHNVADNVSFKLAYDILREKKLTVEYGYRRQSFF